MRAASRPAISLAVGVGGQQHGGRRRRLGQRGQHVDIRGDQVVLHVVGFGDVDLGRARGLQPIGEPLGGAGLGHHHGSRLAQGPGGGDEFVGDLLQRTISVLDEHEYFSHSDVSRFSSTEGMTC